MPGNRNTSKARVQPVERGKISSRTGRCHVRKSTKGREGGGQGVKGKQEQEKSSSVCPEYLTAGPGSAGSEGPMTAAGKGRRTGG